MTFKGFILSVSIFVSFERPRGGDLLATPFDVTDKFFRGGFHGLRPDLF